MSCTDYIIVREKTIDSLEKEVMKYIERGYSPKGGIAEIDSLEKIGFGKFSYCQAMVKKKIRRYVPSTGPR